MEEVRPFYKRTFDDIEKYQSALDKAIAHLQQVKSEVEQFRVRLDEVDSRKCSFCSHPMKDLSLVLNNRGLFAALGGSYSTLEYVLFHGVVVPMRWECQKCFAFDVRSAPDVPRAWDSSNPPTSKSALAAMIF